MNKSQIDPNNLGRLPGPVNNTSGSGDGGTGSGDLIGLGNMTGGNMGPGSGCGSLIPPPAPMGNTCMSQASSSATSPTSPCEMQDSGHTPPNMGHASPLMGHSTGDHSEYKHCATPSTNKPNINMLPLTHTEPKANLNFNSNSNTHPSPSQSTSPPLSNWNMGQHVIPKQEPLTPLTHNNYMSQYAWYPSHDQSINSQLLT